MRGRASAATTIAVILMALAGCASPGREEAFRPEAPHSPATPTAGNPWAEPARDVLVQHCGGCHRGDLDTAVPGALAVYDLTEPVWHARLRPDQYDGILERVREASAIAPEDVAAIEAFVACATGGACPAPPNAGAVDIAPGRGVAP